MAENIAIVGAGFYGLMLAEFLSKKHRVTVFEKNNEPMMGASNLCQMRIHTGMMYPKNLKTLLSCVRTFKPFMLKFKDAIYDEFTSLYAVANSSQMSASEFFSVNNKNGVPIKKVSNGIFNDVQAVFECKEFTFDASEVKRIITERCQSNGVIIKTSMRIYTLDSLSGYDKIFLCNYDGICGVLRNSGIKPPEFKKVTSEKIFFRDNLPDIAATVVDGDFFSMMCLPKRFNGAKTLTGAKLTNTDEPPERSNYEPVFARVRHFIPGVELEYLGSAFGPKVTASVEARGCFVRKETYSKDVYTVLGGKITNVFELFEDLKSI